MDDAALVPDRGIKLSLPLVFFNSNTVFLYLLCQKKPFRNSDPYLYISVKGTKCFKMHKEGFPFIFLHILSLRIDLISRAPANPITLKTDDDIGLRGASTSFQISKFRSTSSLSGLDF